MKSQEVYKYVVDYLKSGACSIEKDEVTMPCPGCGDEGHFSVNIRKGKFNCFKCEVGGNIRYEIQRNKQEWLSLVSRLPSGRPTEYPREARPICSLDGQAISIILRDSLAPSNPEFVAATNASRYCLKRGMTKEQIEVYKGCTKRWSPRVWFPYWNEKVELTYQMGRSMNDELIKPKTLGEPVDSELPLFGRHIHIERDEVVLVEGVFDHFVTPNSYALMGSNITGPQIAQLRLDNIKRAFIILDPDASEQAIHIARRLGNFGIDVFPVVINKYGKDPAELGRKQMTDIVKTLKQHHPIRPQTIHFSYRKIVVMNK
jgi:hypothetical protein